MGPDHGSGSACRRPRAKTTAQSLGVRPAGLQLQAALGPPGVDDEQFLLEPGGARRHLDQPLAVVEQRLQLLADAVGPAAAAARADDLLDRMWDGAVLSALVLDPSGTVKNNDVTDAFADIPDNQQWMLETLLPMLYSEGVRRGRLTVKRMVDVLAGRVDLRIVDGAHVDGVAESAS